MVKRRPGGLSKSKRSHAEDDEKSQKKRQKVEEPKSLEDADLKVELDEINNELKDDEELSELYGLFCKMDESDENLEQLARGVVHECDSVLRAREGKVPAEVDLLYGCTLLVLAEFQPENDEDPESKDDETDSKTQYIEFALDRLQSGLEKEPDHQGLRAAVSKCKLQLLLQEIKSCKSSKRELKLLKKKAEEFEQVLEVANSLKPDADPIHVRRFAELYLAILLFARDLENAAYAEVPVVSDLKTKCLAVHKQCLELADSKDAETVKTASLALGVHCLIEAQPVLMELEKAVLGDDEDEDDEDDSESDDDEEEKSVNKDEEEDEESGGASAELLARATSVIEKGIAFFEKAQSNSKPMVFSELGGLYVHFANLTDDDAAQTKRFKKAIKYLKKAHLHGGEDHSEVISLLEEDLE